MNVLQGIQVGPPHLEKWEFYKSLCSFHGKNPSQSVWESSFKYNILDQIVSLSWHRKWRRRRNRRRGRNGHQQKQQRSTGHERTRYHLNLLRTPMEIPKIHLLSKKPSDVSNEQTKLRFLMYWRYIKVSQFMLKFQTIETIKVLTDQRIVSPKVLFPPPPAQKWAFYKNCVYFMVRIHLNQFENLHLNITFWIRLVSLSWHRKERRNGHQQKQQRSTGHERTRYNSNLLKTPYVGIPKIHLLSKQLSDFWNEQTKLRFLMCCGYIKVSEFMLKISNINDLRMKMYGKKTHLILNS